jgi:putative ABC transport system permease protein
VRGLVIRQVGRTLAVGTTVGPAAAVAAGRLLQATLFGTAPWDPVVYASAFSVIVLMAFAAAYVPARRASCVAPMVALRDE